MDPLPLLHVMYLFAGKRRQSDVTSFLKKFEAAGKCRLVVEEFDIERSPDHDLQQQSLWDDIFTKLRSGTWFLIVSPPCNTFSRRFQWLTHPGPRPLRNRKWPKGFPWLSHKNLEIVSIANAFVENCLNACVISFQAGGNFILEHPEDLGQVNGEHPGTIWHWPEVLDLISSVGASTFVIHQCSFGALTSKPTRLMTSVKISDKRCWFGLPSFDDAGNYKGPLPRHCGHKHVHKLIGKTASKWNTSPSAAYPPAMCQFIAETILYAQASCRGEGGRTVRKVEPIPPWMFRSWMV